MNNLEKLISNLSTYWNITPDQVVDRLNFMNESEINKVVDKMKQKFKNGGVIDCLRNGGSIKDCGCGGRVEKGQDGLQLPRYAKIVEGGGPYARPRTIYYSDDRNNYNVQDGRLISQEEVVNPWGYWNNEITRAGEQFGLELPEVPVQYRDPRYMRYVQHPDGLNLQTATEIDPEKAKGETSDKINKIRASKKQKGGNLEQYPRASRRDAIRAAMDEMGMSRSQARSAYRNMKNGFRNAELSGDELRQRARYGIIDSAYPRAYGSTAPQLPVLNDDVDIEDIPIDLPTGGGIDMSKFSVPNVKKIDTFGGSFNSAFAAARRSGLSEFTWNGVRYDTKLASEDPIQASTGEVKTIAQQAASGARSAVEAYQTGTLPGFFIWGAK